MKIQYIKAFAIHLKQSFGDNIWPKMSISKLRIIKINDQSIKLNIQVMYEKHKKYKHKERKKDMIKRIQINEKKGKYINIKPKIFL